MHKEDPEAEVIAAMDAVIDDVVRRDPDYAYTEGLIDELPPEYLEWLESWQRAHGWGEEEMDE